MLLPFWNFIESDFSGKSEEYKRAASIYFALTVRIKCEVLPEIENIISKDIRMFLFFPKILSQNEKTKVLGALCQLPLAFTIVQIKNKYDSSKSEAINSYLIHFFSENLINPDDIDELLTIIQKNENFLIKAMHNISIIFNREDPFMIAKFMLYSEHLLKITHDTFELLGFCSEHEIIQRMKMIIKE